MNRRIVCLTLAVAGASSSVLLFAGCGDDTTTPVQGVDSGPDVSTPDSTTGTGVDAGADQTTTADVANDQTTADAGSDAASDSSTAPTSCQTSGDGLTNCGASSESCCTSLDVPGGTYYRTYTSSGSGATGLADPATVSGYRLDKYLVTVGRFRRFVDAWNGGAGYAPPAGSGKHAHLNGGQGLANAGSGMTYEPGWVPSDNSNVAPTNANLTCGVSTWTDAAGSQENLPINCVNWPEAYAFCIWDGGFLPSEAEWEYAAAGGSQQREYPWGTTAPGSGNQYAIYDCHYPSDTGGCPELTNVAPVGTATLGAGLWGQLDLAGEVWEWNLDLLATYAACTDCAYLTGLPAGPTPERVLRGNAFGFLNEYLRNDTTMSLVPSARYSFDPTGRYYTNGFRCARTP